MSRLMMRFFLYVSLLLSLYSCSGRPYKELRPGGERVIKAYSGLQPGFDKELYRCVVDGKFLLKKFHVSGILYLKSFSDTAVRVVFQGEMGNTFFDFGWDHKDSFIVYSIMPQMNKPALIRTLRKDFELLLMKGLSAEYEVYEDGAENTWIRYALQSAGQTGRGYAYYRLNREQDKLAGIENADDKRKVVIMDMTPPVTLGTLPDTMIIRHLRAHFTIDMRKIQADAE